MPAQRLAFSSPSPAGGPAEAKRFSQWWEEFRSTVGGREIAADWERPFFASVEYLPLGSVGLGRGRGSINRIERRREHVAADSVDSFVLVINRSHGGSFARAGSRAAAIPSGGAMLFDFAEPSANVYPGDHCWSSLRMPRQVMLSAMANAEDATGIVIPPENQALRLLWRFAESLLDEEYLSEPTVLAQAGQTLVDLLVLALGTNRDTTDIARLRGLRAARLASVLRQIRLDYADPNLTPEQVAGRVGISTRSLHALLHETGLSFSERVQDLRLARVLAVLTGTDGARRKISDAAYDVGFNDLSHFNRVFRRKYGITPTSARGRGRTTLR